MKPDSTMTRVRAALDGLAHSISVRKGIYTVRRGFFYRSGSDSTKFRDAVAKALPGALILDSGEKWTNFRGGAPLAQQSHWWVTFQILPDAVPAPAATPAVPTDWILQRFTAKA